MNSINSNQRVFIVSPTESELTTRGKRHPNFARHLTSHGWNVEYISSNFNHAEKRLFAKEEYQEATQRLPYNLSLINVGGYKRNLSLQRILWHERFAYRCYRLLGELVCENDIIIIPSRPPELIYAVARLKHQYGCRIVLDIRDIWPDALNGSSRFLKRGFGIYCDCFLRHSVTQADAYVHVAPSFLPWLHRYTPTAQSTFIPLGFDERRWGCESPVRLNLQSDIIRLVYCGTLTNQFDIMPVLQSIVKRQNKFHLTLIGDNGTGERYADVMSFIQDQDIKKNITVLGLLPPDKLVLELHRHDVAIIPMVSGALPNKVFDSIATGLPMISLGTGDGSTLIKQNDFGWVTSFNYKSVCTLLDQLNDTNIMEKSKNILKQRSEYMHKNIFVKYEQVINYLLIT